MSSTGRSRCRNNYRSMLGGSDPFSKTSFQMPKLDWLQHDDRIPVTDLHRISAVLCDTGPVHRELA